jgi:nitric oxide reductase activation protein
MYVYKEPKHNPKHALGSIKGRYMNRDGTAILQTAKRIRKFTIEKCLLLVISDGHPAADNYEGEAAIKHTRECVKKVQRMGFMVIQIAIEPNIRSKDMFTDYVELTDVASLPKNLSKVAKKAIRTFSTP